MTTLSERSSSSTRTARKATDEDLARLVGSQVPRVWTPRLPGSHTLGPLMRDVAGVAGIEFDPWQELVGDVGLEIDPETRRLTRRTVVYEVARQNGKTVIFKARTLVSLFALPWERLVLHTAQDRAEPRKMFLELVEAISDTRSLHKRLAKGGIRLANGQESITLKDGSRYRIVAPHERAFRGPSSDLILFDEIREQRDRALWGAALPTQSARPNPQVWATSNAGGPDSVQLAELEVRGRSAAELGDDPSFAYLEWSAHPDRDPDDPQGWAEANPSLGTRITAETIAEEYRSLDADKFETERLCRSVRQLSEPAIPWRKWAECGVDELEELDEALPRPNLAVHVNGDRTHAALVVAARRDGRILVDLLEEWRDPDGIDQLAVASRIVEWMKAHRIRDLAYDRAAATVIADHVRSRRKATLHAISAIEYVIASSSLFDAVSTGQLVHGFNPYLDDQIRAAGRKTRTDGTWFISQAASTEAIPAVVALSFAVNLAYAPRRSAAVHSSSAGTN